jgi:hypothetical protein
VWSGQGAATPLIGRLADLHSKKRVQARTIDTVEAWCESRAMNHEWG